MKFSLSTRTIQTDLPAFVMGIVNVTPDSFWKESRGGFEHALKLIEQGADILDIGGESSRPGSAYVSEEEELSRIIPVIQEIRKVSDIPISVDTRKKNVMEKAFEAGADILNDISALEDDWEMGKFCGKHGIPVILMHKRGTPADMQNNTSYEDVFKEINDYLVERAEYAISCGISEDKIILDHGVGFGKTVEENDPVTVLSDTSQIMADEENGFSHFLEFLKFVIALGLEKYIADGKRLVHNQNLRVNIDGHRKCQPHKHSAGIALYRLVDKLPDIRKIQNILKSLVDLLLGNGKRGKLDLIKFFAIFKQSLVSVLFYVFDYFGNNSSDIGFTFGSCKYFFV